MTDNRGGEHGGARLDDERDSKKDLTSEEEENKQTLLDFNYLCVRVSRAHTTLSRSCILLCAAIPEESGERPPRRRDKLSAK